MKTFAEYMDNPKAYREAISQPMPTEQAPKKEQTKWVLRKPRNVISEHSGKFPIQVQVHFKGGER